MTLLILFTLELVYYVSTDLRVPALLAGLRVLGMLVYVCVTKRRLLGTRVDTLYQGTTVIPIDRARKKRF